MEKKESIIRSRGFNIAFVLGELRLYFGTPADAQTAGQGWVMLFATAACVIIKRHRRRSARRGVTAVGADRVDSRGGHQNPSPLADIRSGRTEEYHSLAFLSVESLREPPPAYIPLEGLPRDGVMRLVDGFQVSVDDLLWSAPR